MKKSQKINLFLGIVFAILFMVCGAITIINLINNDRTLLGVNLIAVATCGWSTITRLLDVI